MSALKPEVVPQVDSQNNIGIESIQQNGTAPASSKPTSENGAQIQSVLSRGDLSGGDKLHWVAEGMEITSKDKDTTTDQAEQSQSESSKGQETSDGATSERMKAISQIADGATGDLRSLRAIAEGNITQESKKKVQEEEARLEKKRQRIVDALERSVADYKAHVDQLGERADSRDKKSLHVTESGMDKILRGKRRKSKMRVDFSERGHSYEGVAVEGVIHHLGSRVLELQQKGGIKGELLTPEERKKLRTYDSDLKTLLR
ncbi:MAG TPA: hypothetical protein VK338_03925, partial [Candidatus Nitrosocosmicus sp.]|nr:hypothetical protein [Candidatus Nitrosocosmicus sp.]